MHTLYRETQGILVCRTKTTVFHFNMNTPFISRYQWLSPESNTLCFSELKDFKGTMKVMVCSRNTFKSSKADPVAKSLLSTDKKKDSYHFIYIPSTYDHGLAVVDCVLVSMLRKCIIVGKLLNNNECLNAFDSCDLECVNTIFDKILDGPVPLSFGPNSIYGRADIYHFDMSKIGFYKYFPYNNLNPEGQQIGINDVFLQDDFMHTTLSIDSRVTEFVLTREGIVLDYSPNGFCIHDTSSKLAMQVQGDVVQYSQTGGLDWGLSDKAEGLLEDRQTPAESSLVGFEEQGAQKKRRVVKKQGSQTFNPRACCDYVYFDVDMTDRTKYPVMVNFAQKAGLQDMQTLYTISNNTLTETCSISYLATPNSIIIGDLGYYRLYHPDPILLLSGLGVYIDTRSNQTYAGFFRHGAFYGNVKPQGQHANVYIQYPNDKKYISFTGSINGWLPYNGVMNTDSGEIKYLNGSQIHGDVSL